MLSFFSSSSSSSSTHSHYHSYYHFFCTDTVDGAVAPNTPRGGPPGWFVTCQGVDGLIPRTNTALAAAALRPLRRQPSGLCSFTVAGSIRCTLPLSFACSLLHPSFAGSTCCISSFILLFLSLYLIVFNLLPIVLLITFNLHFNHVARLA